MRKLPSLVSLGLSLSLVLAACAGGPSASSPAPADSTPLPTAAAPLAPTASPTPDPAVLADGGVEVVGLALTLLADHHIAEPEAATLLRAAWQALETAAGRQGVSAAEHRPDLPASREEAWEVFRAAYAALMAHVPESGQNDLRYAALEGMTRSLNDCHTFFLRPRRSEALSELRGGRSLAGVGIQVLNGRPDLVREVLSGSPAEAAGVRPGDRIVSINGVAVGGLAHEVVEDLLRGDPGSPVRLGVRRPPAGEILWFDLERAQVAFRPVESRLLEEGIGYIRIRVFSSGGAVREGVAAALSRFEAAGLRAWVLDLRDNPGGDRDLGLDGLFIDEGVAELTLLRGGGLESQEAMGDAFPERPMAVLVNQGTASVAEIFAAMLQDYGRARVFGVTTARCAGFVHLAPLPDGGTLGVTIGHSLTPLSQEPLYRTGVVPDEVLQQTIDDLAAGRDPVLARALAWLAATAP